MNYLLCTIGFAGKTAQEFLTLLKEAGVQQLIDIRQNRGGQLSGYAKHPDLAYFLREIAGIAYVHEPLLAPAPELLKSYRKTKDWAGYETAFLALMKNRGVPEILDTASWPSRIVLLCSEAGPEKCHRRLVADLIAMHWGGQGHDVEIRHLVSAATKPAKPRRKKIGATP
jgi:uncharacterized protein (DUF488 family)